MIVRNDAPPGTACVRGWTERAYFADRDHVARSRLMKLTDSIAAFDCPDDDDKTYRGTDIKGARLGTVVHMHRLERAEYDRRVIPWEAQTGKNAVAVLAALALVDPDLSTDELTDNARTWLTRAWNGEQPPEPRPAIRANKSKGVTAVPGYPKTAIDREAKEALLEIADAFDLMLLRPQDIRLVLAIEAAIDDCPKALEYLEGGKHIRGKPPTEILREVSITWTDKASGLACRARLDVVLVYADCVVVVDLKTTLKTPSGSRFGDTAVNEGYYHQAAFYTRGAYAVFERPAHFVWVAVKNTDGLVAAAHKPDAEILDMADDTVGSLLQRLARIQNEERRRDRWQDKMNVATPSRGGAARMAAIKAEAEAALEAMGPMPTEDISTPTP